MMLQMTARSRFDGPGDCEGEKVSVWVIEGATKAYGSGKASVRVL